MQRNDRNTDYLAYKNSGGNTSGGSGNGSNNGCLGWYLLALVIFIIIAKILGF